MASLIYPGLIYSGYKNRSVYGNCHQCMCRGEVTQIWVSRISLPFLVIFRIILFYFLLYYPLYWYYNTFLVFCRFVNIVIAVYGAFAEIFDHTNISQDSYKEFGLVVDGLYCSILLFIFCDCSHNATLCVAEGIQNVLLKIDVRQINTKAKSEIDLFIFAIEMNPAIVSLKGYVNVNRELLTSVRKHPFKKTSSLYM